MERSDNSTYSLHHPPPTFVFDDLDQDNASDAEAIQNQLLTDNFGAKSSYSVDTDEDLLRPSPYLMAEALAADEVVTPSPAPGQTNPFNFQTQVISTTPIKSVRLIQIFPTSG